MKKHLLFIVTVLWAVLGFSQIDSVSIYDIQYVSPSDLSSCIDDSPHLGDTVYIVGVVVHDGNLTEVPSGSVTGGCRPGIHLLDTANLGAGGDFRGVQVHGVEAVNNSVPVSDIHTLFAGDVVEVTGVVGSYQGETQIYPLGNSYVNVLSSGVAPQPRVVSVGDLNDPSRVNVLPTGELIEGSFVMLNNVTITAVNFFSGGSRVFIEVEDQFGNKINVTDRFLAQKLPSSSTVNPNSPSSVGSFVAPPVGMVYDTLVGIVIQSENGCTGGVGRGYEINPFDPSHYSISNIPPVIANTNRVPTVPTSSDSPNITCEISDLDGSVSSAYLHYTNDIISSSFDSVSLNLVTGTTNQYTAHIPAMAEGEMVGYFIRAEDNQGNISQMPVIPSGGTANGVTVYTVRDNGLQIVDVQKVLDYNNDASYYLGDTVTVTGVVSASAQNYDLGSIHIQQQGVTEWGGLQLIGNSNLVTLQRTEEIIATGVIEEYYGLTRMNVITVSSTGNIIPNLVTYINPSDDSLYVTNEIEKYEGMLIGLENGSNGLFMTNPNYGFGVYEIGSSPTAVRSTKVLAGRQSTNSFSSLWFSLISDPAYYNVDGQMNVDTVITRSTIDLDTLMGIFTYHFGNPTLLPRNNDDVLGLAENGIEIILAQTNLNIPTSNCDFDLGANTVLCSTDTIRLDASYGYYNYLWKLNGVDLFVDDQFFDFHDGISGGIGGFEIVAIVFDTISGCTSTDTIMVELESCATSIYDIQYVSPSDLTNCIGSSQYEGDTVTVVGVAIHDGNLTEVMSSSVFGGCRPGIHLVDTAGGAMGDFKGIQIHGVSAVDNSKPISSIHEIKAGNVVEIKGVVGSYQGETQIYPLWNSSVSVLDSMPVPQVRAVAVEELNDTNGINQLITGEALEGSLVMLNNVTVTNVYYFSAGRRVQLEVADQFGNKVRVGDRFLVQKLSANNIVNPYSPSTTGSFVVPEVGTTYDTLMGIVIQSENGCTGGNGSGYEINPFDETHYSVDTLTSSIWKVQNGEYSFNPGVYPNPIKLGNTSGKTMLKLDNLPESVEIEVFGFTGERIIRINTEKNGMRLPPNMSWESDSSLVWDIESSILKQGVYIIRFQNLSTEEFRASKLLIIK